MKRTALILLAAALLTGCAGLSVNFDAAVSYRSDVPLGQRKQ
jgi:PBP1b-binding outer membrane lipoprotein LpoB